MVCPPLIFFNSHSGTSATNWCILPAPGDCKDGEFGGIKIGRGNRSTRRSRKVADSSPDEVDFFFFFQFT
jgi:hypothetical protein